MHHLADLRGTETVPKKMKNNCPEKMQYRRYEL